MFVTGGNDVLYGENGGLHDFDEVLEAGEIQGMTSEEALEKVKGLVKKMDVEVDHMKVYPLSVDNLTTLNRLFMSDEEYAEYLEDPTNAPIKREYSKKEEAYLVLIELAVHGNALHNDEYDYAGRWYPAPMGIAIVDREELVEFDLTGIYDVDETVSRETKGIPLEEAKEMMTQKFEDVISYDKVECEEIRQRYVAVSDGKEEKVSFVPAYVFVLNQTITTVKQGESNTVQMGSTLLLDMENGKWIE